MVSLEEMIKKEGETQKDTPKKTASTSSGDYLQNIWNAKSGSKADSAYKDHALNWDKKDSTGKIIKGLEGLAGNLDRAVIDIGVGIAQKIGEFFNSITGKKE